MTRSFGSLLTLALLVPSVATAETAAASPARTTPVGGQATYPSISSPTASPFAFWLADPRRSPEPAEPELVRVRIHGEYQARYTELSSLPLESYGLEGAGPTLGQARRAQQWLRLTPSVSYRRNLTLTMQADVPTGMLVGHENRGVYPDPQPLSDRMPMSFAGRWLYVDIAAGPGLLRIGQQPARWGSGLLVADGDERQMFGDARVGTIVERIAWQGRPLGRTKPLELLVASDLVFSDGQTSLVRGDRELRANLGLSYVSKSGDRLGLLLVGKSRKPHQSDRVASELAPSERTVTVDLAGQTRLAIPGHSTVLIAEGEAAVELGRSELDGAVAGNPATNRVQRYGALSRIGLVTWRSDPNRRGIGSALLLEWGYASGDAAPNDGVDRQFTAHPGRRIGIVLFDEVLRWKSARASAAESEHFSAAGLPSDPRRTASGGGVTNAVYLGPQLLHRPTPALDLRLGMLVAQAASDVVDRARLRRTGGYVNFDGGSPTSRDLGLELDAAVEYRISLAPGIGTSLGAEGGVLFPGRALANSAGEPLGTQSLARARFGFYF